MFLEWQNIFFIETRTEKKSCVDKKILPQDKKNDTVTRKFFLAPENVS